MQITAKCELSNCASTYLDMYFTPAVMQVWFWNWLFKVKLLHSHFWPLKVWLHTREWRVCKKIFVQHFGTWQSKFDRKMCDYFQFSKPEGLGKMFLLYAFHYEEARYKSCMTNI